MSKADNKMDSCEHMVGRPGHYKPQPWTDNSQQCHLATHDDRISHNCRQHWLVSRGVQIICSPAVGGVTKILIYRFISFRCRYILSYCIVHFNIKNFDRSIFSIYQFEIGKNHCNESMDINGIPFPYEHMVGRPLETATLGRQQCQGHKVTTLWRDRNVCIIIIIIIIISPPTMIG